MVTWVLETNVFAEECFDRMVAHLKATDTPYHLVRVIPFIHEVDGKLPDVEEGPVVVYGSIGTQLLARRQGWSPGVWTGPEFNEEVVRQRLGTDYLNHDLVVCRFGDVLERFSGERFFIKPNTDSKEFAGEVISRVKFDDWTKGMIASGYVGEDIEDLEVVVSEPKELGNEWRLVIVDGQVSDCCVYRRYRKVMPLQESPPEVIEFARRMVGRFNPSPVFVMDVCEAEDGYKVIEVNTFNSAGLYAIDVTKVIDDINAHVEATHLHRFAK